MQKYFDITDSKKNNEIETEMRDSVNNLSNALSEMTKTVDQATKDMIWILQRKTHVKHAFVH